MCVCFFFACLNRLSSEVAQALEMALESFGVIVLVEFFLLDVPN